MSDPWTESYAQRLAAEEFAKFVKRAREARCRYAFQMRYYKTKQPPEGG